MQLCMFKRSGCTDFVLAAFRVHRPFIMDPQAGQASSAAGLSFCNLPPRLERTHKLTQEAAMDPR